MDLFHFKTKKFENKKSDLSLNINKYYIKEDNKNKFFILNSNYFVLICWVILS
jgi:hypothetical protein